MHGVCRTEVPVHGPNMLTALLLFSIQYGMECLFRFYSYGLEKAFSAELYRDFEETTLKDFKATVPPRLYGLEKVGSGRRARPVAGWGTGAVASNSRQTREW